MPVIARISNPNRPRRRRRRLRTIRMTPTLVTLGNLICGFAAVHYAMRGMYDFGRGIPPEQIQTLGSVRWEQWLSSNIAVGAALVVLGMIFDCFDGLLARMTRNTTDFGGQLDSLADVVTSGLAPAVLMVAFLTQTLSVDLSPVSHDIVGRAAWIAAAVYLACAAIRLARYNVEHAQSGHDGRGFRGLPSPGAAGVIVGLLLFQEQGRGLPSGTIVYVMPAVAFAAGLLMVSRVPYPRMTYLFSGRRPFEQLILIIVVFVVFWLYKVETFAVAVFVYGLSGPVLYALRRFRKRSAPSTTDVEEENAPTQSSRSA